MKVFDFEPGYKKSFIEIRNFKKQDGDTYIHANYEIGWRWGNVHIYVPETKEEVIEWLKYRDVFEDYDEQEIDELSQFSNVDFIEQEVEIENEDGETITETILVSTINPLFIPEFKQITNEDGETVLVALDSDAEVELDDYWYELQECWDGCWEDWYIYSTKLSDEEKEELSDELRDLYNEGWEEALDEAGWEESGCYFVTVSGYKITPISEVE